MKFVEVLQNCKRALSCVTVEPALFCYMFSVMMTGLAGQILSLEKACRVELKYSDSICDALTARDNSQHGSIEEIEVQKLSATMGSVKDVLRNILPCLLLLFVGSWSDRHKRRSPTITIPMLGDILAVIGLLLCTYYFFQLPIIVNTIIEALPGIAGGTPMVLMGTNSYICDNSDVKTRTMRLGILTLTLSSSAVIGNTLGGILYSRIGLYGLFTVSLCVVVVGFNYSLSRIKDVGDNQSFSFKDFFGLEHIKSTLMVVFRPREGRTRSMIVMVFMLVIFVIGPIYGETSILFLLVRYKYHWSEVDYGLFLIFVFIIQLIGTTISLAVFSKYLNLNDALIGMLAVAFKAISSILGMIAPNTFVFYIGGIFDMMIPTSIFAMRSIISKLVDKDELGKVNSIFEVFESLNPLLFGPLYSLMYRATIEMYPGFTFCVGAILAVPSMFMFLYIYKHSKDQQK